LIDQELLALVSVKHFLGVSWHKGVEVSVKFLRVGKGLLFHWLFLRSQNSTQALGFLPTGTEMRRDLDNHIGSWQVNSSITNSWEEYSIDFVSMLEVVQYAHSFLVRDLSIYERLLKFLSVELECVYVIWKHDDFISSALMQIYEILTWQELIGIINVQGLLRARGSF
jgi:hypothetical protein